MQEINNTPIGHELIHFSTIGSTNDFASELVSKSRPIEGTVVSADFQSKGRGQYGRKWESSASENITLSVIMCPSFLDIKDQFYLNMAVSLSIVDLIAAYASLIPKVKWPNDVYVSKEKISGILIQNFLHGQVIQYSVFGIGINVNQRVFPTDVPNPTSLTVLTDQEFVLKEVREDLFQFLQIRYDQLKNDKKMIRRDYMDHLLGLQTPGKFKIGDELVEGTIQDIDHVGRLIISIDGTEKSFVHGALSQLIG